MLKLLSQIFIVKFINIEWGIHMKNQLFQKFNEIFGEGENIELYFSPGRVNLIGEHTDYNGGHVFPCALTIGTYGAVRKNNSNTLRFYSMNYEQLGIITSNSEDIKYSKEADWANYPKAVFWAIKEKGYKTPQGLDILYYGNIPNQSGLSSSASIEVLTGYIIKSICGLDFDMIELAQLCKTAENQFIGVNCGIMDQFAIAMGKKDHGVFLDTNTLEYEYAPVILENKKIIIANTNRKRELSDSKYNERREECESALFDLQKIVDIQSLGDLKELEFEEIKHFIQNPVCRIRAKHAVYENQRTVLAVTALKNHNLSLFGQLMKESHISLRDDYQVSCRELDTLVEAAWEQEGVIGSRMTGAGFGGCTVSIVDQDQVDSFINNVGKIYEDEIGYKADFYVVDIGGGPCKIDE